MKHFLVAFLLLPTLSETVDAATFLYSPLDSLDGWTVRAVGATDVTVIEKSDSAHCVQIASQGGTVFLTREISIDQVAGCRVTLSCLVQTENIMSGVQRTSTAKIHLAVETPGGTRHFAAPMTGSTDWHHEGFTADVPANATRVVLNLGMEACSGVACFDRLLVRNDRRGIHTIDLTESVNAGHDQLGLDAFPQDAINWNDIPLDIINGPRNQDSDCLRLAGIDHEDWPKATTRPIPIGRPASTIYILHGTLGGPERSDTPCAIWSAKFTGGQSPGLSLFQGREIGRIGQTSDLENWKVAWTGRGETDDKTITFGVTEWKIYSDTPIESISCRAYLGAPPVVVAITIVEEPPVVRDYAQEMLDEAEF